MRCAVRRSAGTSRSWWSAATAGRDGHVGRSRARRTAGRGVRRPQFTKGAGGGVLLGRSAVLDECGLVERAPTRRRRRADRRASRRTPSAAGPAGSAARSPRARPGRPWPGGGRRRDRPAPGVLSGQGLLQLAGVFVGPRAYDGGRSRSPLRGPPCGAARAAVGVSGMRMVERTVRPRRGTDRGRRTCCPVPRPAAGFRMTAARPQAGADGGAERDTAVRTAGERALTGARDCRRTGTFVARPDRRARTPGVGGAQY